MKIERRKNAFRNIVFGFVLKIYQIIMPFVMRTAMLYLLGVEYLGLNSLFTSVLQVLNLVELGVGSAMVFSMYEPIAKDKTDTICALMKLYKIYYRIIGVVIAVCGGILLPFIPKLIHGTVPPDMNVYILYIINLTATVFSYWLFAYKNSILQAHQRADVTSKVIIVTDTLKYILQLLVLVFVKSYYFYVCTILLSQILTNIITAYYSDKLYPQYVANGKLDKNKISVINKRIRDLFTSKIGGVILNSSDTIVISAFLGLEILAVYQNYYYILTAIIGIIAVVFNACRAGIGNSLAIESESKNFSDFQLLLFIIAWITGECSISLLCLFQPFMKLWVGEKLMLDFKVVICLCVYFYLYEINQLMNVYKDAAGIWHEDRFRPLITSLVNLGLNVIMVQFIGIYGIILSTVLAMLFVGMPWLTYNLFTVLFAKKHLRSFLKKIFTYVGVTSVTAVVLLFVCTRLHFATLELFFCRAIICVLVPNLIFALVYNKKEEYVKSKGILINAIKKQR